MFCGWHHLLLVVQTKLDEIIPAEAAEASAAAATKGAAGTATAGHPWETAGADGVVARTRRNLRIVVAITMEAPEQRVIESRVHPPATTGSGETAPAESTASRVQRVVRTEGRWVEVVGAYVTKRGGVCKSSTWAAPA